MVNQSNSIAATSTFHADFSNEFSSALKIAHRLPKSKLHLHLDGSLPPEFIFERARARGMTGLENENHRNFDPDFPNNKEKLRAFIDKAKDIMRKKGGFAGVKQGKNMMIFDWMNQFLQTAEELEQATYLLLKDLRRNHMVKLVEIRFCPTLHTKEGLTEEKAVKSVLSGMERAERDLDETTESEHYSSIPSNSRKQIDSFFARDKACFRTSLIICCVRTLPRPHPLNMAKLTNQFLAKQQSDCLNPPIISPRVLAFDVSGPEKLETGLVSNPGIREALVYCKENKVPMTLHAGEVKKNGGQIQNLAIAVGVSNFHPWTGTSISEMDPSTGGFTVKSNKSQTDLTSNDPETDTGVSLEADRIGHGFAFGVGEGLYSENKEISASILQVAAQKQKPFKVCMTSNVHPAVVPSYKEHPVRKMFEAGIPVCISSNNLTLSGYPDMQRYPEMPFMGSFYAYPAGEIAHLQVDLGFSWKEIKAVLINGVRHSFIWKNSKKAAEKFQDQFERDIDKVLEPYYE